MPGPEIVVVFSFTSFASFVVGVSFAVVVPVVVVVDDDLLLMLSLFVLAMLNPFHLFLPFEPFGPGLATVVPCPFFIDVPTNVVQLFLPAFFVHTRDTGMFEK